MKDYNDNTCGYSTEWQPYLNDYDKFEYDVKLKDGTIITNCYPNAGFFNGFGKGQNNKKADSPEVAEIRITPKENQILGINPDYLYINSKI